MSDRDYCYPPEYTVLRNRLDIRGAAALDAGERELVVMRLLEPVPAGAFDLAHLKAIHRHLFQDVYTWAGEVRTVEISKPHRLISSRRTGLHRPLPGGAGHAEAPGEHLIVSESSEITRHYRKGLIYRLE